LWPDLGPHRAMTGIECKMNFLGAAQAPGAALVAIATMLRQGRTIAVCESVIHQGDRLVAKGTFTFLQRAR
jgi:acyl-coenzyme A thioesterase PaaI-like protein